MKAISYIVAGLIILGTHVLSIIIWVGVLDLPELRGTEVRLYATFVLFSFLATRPLGDYLAIQIHEVRKVEKEQTPSEIRNVIKQWNNVQKGAVITGLVCPFLLLPVLGETGYTINGSRTFYGASDYSVIIGIWLGCIAAFFLWSNEK